MTARGCDHFCTEVTTTLHRLQMEYDMSYAEIIGCLHIMAAELAIEALEDETDEPGEED